MADKATPTPPVDAGAAQNMQDRKTAFLNASTDKRTVSSDRLDAKASPYVVPGRSKMNGPTGLLPR
jgi:hypothetical protein